MNKYVWLIYQRNQEPPETCTTSRYEHNDIQFCLEDTTLSSGRHVLIELGQHSHCPETSTLAINKMLIYVRTRGETEPTYSVLEPTAIARSCPIPASSSIKTTRELELVEARSTLYISIHTVSLGISGRRESPTGSYYQDTKLKR